MVKESIIKSKRGFFTIFSAPAAKKSVSSLKVPLYCGSGSVFLRVESRFPMGTIMPPCKKKAGEDNFHNVNPCGTDEYKDSKKISNEPRQKKKSASDHKK